MKILNGACAALAFCALLLPVPASAGAQLAGYGDSYVTAGGETRVHRGRDVGAVSGEPYPSPCGGTVVFAGRVPTAEGASVLAVSLDTAQGRVSVMPFESTSVCVGQEIVEGTALGRIAGAGDASSSLPHAHVSLRVAGDYVDPSSLFEAVGRDEPEPEPLPEQQPVTEAAAPVAGPAEPAADVAAASGVAVPDPLTAGGSSVAANVPAVAPSGAMAAGNVGASTGFDAVGSPAGGSITGKRARRPMSGLEAMRGIAHGRAADLVHAARRACRGVSNLSHPLSRYACLTVPFLLALGASEERRLIQSVSHRLGTLLRQSRAGATIRGLTSCSGR